MLFLLLAVNALHLHAQFTRQYGIEGHTNDSREGQTREMDRTNVHVVIGTILHADGNNQNQGCHKHVA